MSEKKIIFHLYLIYNYLPDQAATCTFRLNILDSIKGLPDGFIQNQISQIWYFEKGLVLKILAWFSGFNLVLWKYLGFLVLIWFYTMNFRNFAVFGFFSGISAKLRHFFQWYVSWTKYDNNLYQKYSTHFFRIKC